MLKYNIVMVVALVLILTNSTRLLEAGSRNWPGSSPVFDRRAPTICANVPGPVFTTQPSGAFYRYTTGKPVPVDTWWQPHKTEVMTWYQSVVNDPAKINPEFKTAIIPLYEAALIGKILKTTDFRPVCMDLGYIVLGRGAKVQFQRLYDKKELVKIEKRYQKIIEQVERIIANVI